MCPVPNGFRDTALDVIARIKGGQVALRRATRHDLTRVAKCTDMDGEIFEKLCRLNNKYWY
jgi:hypothetical protein